MYIGAMTYSRFMGKKNEKESKKKKKLQDTIKCLSNNNFNKINKNIIKNFIIQAPNDF